MEICDQTDCCAGKYTDNQSMCNTNNDKLMTIYSLSTIYNLNNLWNSSLVCGYGYLTLTTAGLIGE